MTYQHHLIEIDIGRIKVNPLNPRKHQGEAFDQLKASIEEMGIIIPRSCEYYSPVFMRQ